LASVSANRHGFNTLMDEDDVNDAGLKFNFRPFYRRSDDSVRPGCINRKARALCQGGGTAVTSERAVTNSCSSISKRTRNKIPDNSGISDE